jgi:ATP-dependent protease ClpP protease subunit
MEETNDEEDFAGESTAERIIRLTGEISEETAEKFALKLHEVAEIPGEITIIISSDGGDIEEGLRIIDSINIAKAKGCPVKTIVSGKGYSMAAFIACCGDTRTMYPHARLMFHSGRYEGMNEDDVLTVSTLRSMEAELTLFNNTFATILRNVGVSEDMIAKMLSGDVYVNAEDAISLGIIHSIETQVI